MQEIWLVGSGGMAISYYHVMQALQLPSVVIGRGTQSAEFFTSKTSKEVVTGGLETYLKNKPAIPEACIVSVGVDDLYQTTLTLLQYGVKKILVEKPGALFAEELSTLNTLAQAENAVVFIGYNRRYYSSVEKAQEIIQNDGGLVSFNFELTEPASVINKLNKSPMTKARWFLANTTHVADLAFYIGGKPELLHSMVSGSLDFHPPSPSLLMGHGKTNHDVFFSYNANWKSPGRWSIEFLTEQSRLILRPMEQLHIQQQNSFEINKVTLDDHLDCEFKPGLYKQVHAFINNSYDKLCTLASQIDLFPVYEKIAGYHAASEL